MVANCTLFLKELGYQRYMSDDLSALAFFGLKQSFVLVESLG